MFKKVLVSLSLLVVLFGVSACGKTISSYVLENMAEITEEYYFGENEEMVVTISKGQRESVYRVNGEATDLVDCALLTIRFKEENIRDAMALDITSQGTTVQVEAEYNSFNNTYMKDIVDDIALGDEVSVVYEGQTLALTKQNFSINSQKAIEIASETLSEELDALKSYNNFNGECYLRIINMKDNDFSDLYWCFTCVDREGNNITIILSTETGDVLASSLDENDE